MKTLHLYLRDIPVSQRYAVHIRITLYRLTCAVCPKMDDDTPQLSPETAAILAAFLQEREATKKAHTDEAKDATATLAKTQEDWQLSQFWYDEATGILLARELLAAAADHVGTSSSSSSSSSRSPTCIVCVSAPSAYKALLAVGLKDNASATKAYILEYDRRFGEAFGEDAFVFYDFNHPREVPSRLHGQADVILLDPPFLNESTLTCYAETVALLRKDADTRVMLCSGAVMLPFARSLLGLRPVRAAVRHANQLSNPFLLYVSHGQSAARLEGWDTEAEEADARAQQQQEVQTASSSSSSL
jgi:hypothetical protein